LFGLGAKGLKSRYENKGIHNGDVVFGNKNVKK